MLPSEKDVRNKLIQLINNYLKTTPLSFSDIKKLITDKKTIDSIHAKLVNFLHTKRRAYQQEAQKKAEELAWKEQCEEDDQQSKNDKIEQERDNEDLKFYKSKLDSNTISHTDMEERCESLQKKIAAIKSQIQSGSVHIQVTNFKHLSAIGEPASLAPYAMNQVNAHIKHFNNYQTKIARLNTDNASIHLKCEALTKRTQARKDREIERNARQTARNNYNTNKYGLEKTLTQQRQNQLNKNIDEERQIIECEYARLIDNSLKIHFSLLLQQIKSTPFPMNANEKDALTIIIRLMDSHLQHEYNYAITNERLTQNAKKLLADEQELEQIRKDIIRIEEVIAPLIKQNDGINNNTASPKEYERCVNLSKKLSYSVLLFLSLTFLSLIPMFLFYGGVISIASSFLVTTTPILLGLTTVASSLMSSFYKTQAKRLFVTNKNNTLTLKSNEEKIHMYTQMLNKTNAITIPKLEAQITAAKQTQQLLQAQLIQYKQLTDDTLNQIQSTVPISFAQSSLHKPPPPPTTPLTTSTLIATSTI